MIKLVEVVFTDEDKKNLKVLAKELPKLRLLVERLVETLEILSGRELTESIKASEKDVKEGRVMSLEALLKELGINKQATNQTIN